MTRFNALHRPEVVSRKLLASVVAGWLAWSSPIQAQDAEAPTAPPAIPQEHFADEAPVPQPLRAKPARVSRGRHSPKTAESVRPRSVNGELQLRVVDEPTRIQVAGTALDAEDEVPVASRPRLTRPKGAAPSRKQAVWAEPISPDEENVEQVIEQVDGESLVPGDGLLDEPNMESEGDAVEPDSPDTDSSDEGTAPLLGPDTEIEIETVEEEPAGVAAPGEPSIDEEAPLVEEVDIEEVVEPAPLRQHATQPRQLPRHSSIDRTAAIDDSGTYNQAGDVGKYGPQDKVHQVASGDSFWTISKKHYRLGRYSAALAEYNKSRNPKPDKIKPGMKIIIPPVETLEEKFPHLISGLAPSTSRAVPAAPVKSGFFVDTDGQPMYRVGEGDTLSDIAQNHLGRSSRWPQIVKLNRDQLPDPDQMKLGIILRLPADASEAIAAE